LSPIATADTVRDLDYLRRLVGDRNLTVFGESFGTLIGQTYANMFPRRVRAMALDGLIDPVASNAGMAAVLASGLADTDRKPSAASADRWWAGWSVPPALPGRRPAPTVTPAPGTPPLSIPSWSSVPGSTHHAAS
jgi:pimeloyl-ACP methyl ester carboxylesterase